MLDKTKRYLVVGLGLLGGKYALELTKAGFHVDGINRSEGHLQYALSHGYIASGKTHDFEDLVQQADHIIFGLYPISVKSSKAVRINTRSRNVNILERARQSSAGRF